MRIFPNTRKMVKRIQFTPTVQKPAVELDSKLVLDCFDLRSFQNKYIFVDRDNHNTVCKLAGICGPHADEALDISQHYDLDRCDRAYNLLNWVLYSHGYHLVSIKNQRSKGKVIYALSVMLPLSQNAISASALSSGEYTHFSPMTSYERHLDRAIAEVATERQQSERHYQELLDENPCLRVELESKSHIAKDFEIQLQAATDTIKQLREAHTYDIETWKKVCHLLKQKNEDLEKQLAESQQLKTLFTNFMSKQQ